MCQLVPAPKPLGGPEGTTGEYRDLFDIKGDTTSPIDMEWNAEVNPDRALNP